MWGVVSVNARCASIRVIAYGREPVLADPVPLNKSTYLLIYVSTYGKVGANPPPMRGGPGAMPCADASGTEPLTGLGPDG
jgi:hypothetical protein